MTATEPVVLPTNAESTAADRAHVFHSWSAQGLIAPLPIAGGSGATFWDNEGNRYLDFASQLVNLNLGHQHPPRVTGPSPRQVPLVGLGPGEDPTLLGGRVRRSDRRPTAHASSRAHRSRTVWCG